LSLKLSLRVREDSVGGSVATAQPTDDAALVCNRPCESRE
jgi:hypothetical protein